jgi:hypothetical protein
MMHGQKTIKTPCMLSPYTCDVFVIGHWAVITYTNI